MIPRLRHSLIGLILLAGMTSPSSSQTTFEEALDAPGLSFTTYGTGGNSGWAARRGSEANDGIDYAIGGVSGWQPTLPGEIPPSESSVLQTTVTGPATFSFYWRVWETQGGGVSFYVDNQSKGFLSNGFFGGPLSSWAYHGVEIPAGAHDCKWVIQSRFDPTGFFGVQGYVDKVLLTPKPISLVEALDNPLLTYTASTPDAWAGQATTTHDGSDAAASREATSASPPTRLSAVVNGPARLQFFWKTEGTSTTGRLTFSEGGSAPAGTWQLASYAVGSGQHTVTWEVADPTGAPTDSTRGYVDQVIIVPGEFLPTPPIALETVPNDPGHVRIVWPASAIGWTVEESSDLVTWTRVDQAPATSGSSQFITVPVPSGDRFFRIVGS